MDDLRCAVCQLSDGLVVNIIMASPADPPPAECMLVPINENQVCDMGWTWDGVNFIEPVSAVE